MTTVNKNHKLPANVTIIEPVNDEAMMTVNEMNALMFEAYANMKQWASISGLSVSQACDLLKIYCEVTGK